MLVKFFKRGGTLKTNKGSRHRTAGGKGVHEYLLGTQDRPRENARVLQGDPSITTEIINGLNYSKIYTSGCLSFDPEESKNITERDKLELIESFENILFTELDKDQYTGYWVEHTDKGRLELNFVFANVDLRNNKYLSVYYHKTDLKLVDAWKDKTNIERNFSDPNDPNRRQLFQIESKIVKSEDLKIPNDNTKAEKERFKADLSDLLIAHVYTGNIKDRSDVVRTLSDLGQEHGFSISRQSDDSISIAFDNVNAETKRKNLKLKGLIYETKFNSKLIADVELKQNEHDRTTAERLERATTIYDRELEKRSSRTRQRHRSNTAEIKTRERKHESVITNNDREFTSEYAGPNNQESKRDISDFAGPTTADFDRDTADTTKNHDRNDKLQRQNQTAQHESIERNQARDKHTSILSTDFSSNSIDSDILYSSSDIAEVGDNRNFDDFYFIGDSDFRNKKHERLNQPEQPTSTAGQNHERNTTDYYRQFRENIGRIKSRISNNDRERNQEFVSNIIGANNGGTIEKTRFCNVIGDSEHIASTHSIKSSIQRRERANANTTRRISSYATNITAEHEHSRTFIDEYQKLSEQQQRENEQLGGYKAEYANNSKSTIDFRERIQQSNSTIKDITARNTREFNANKSELERDKAGIATNSRRFSQRISEITQQIRDVAKTKWQQVKKWFLGESKQGNLYVGDEQNPRQKQLTVEETEQYLDQHPYNLASYAELKMTRKKLEHEKELERGFGR